MSVLVITLPSMFEAETVRDALLDLAEGYGNVTRADYFNLVGANSTYEDEKVGWVDLKQININKVGKDEFVLDLPPATTIY